MLRFGIVGTNFISEWFADACRRTQGRAEAVAVCSRQLPRAEEFAAKARVANSFDDLDAMLEEVDALYIASPNAAIAATRCRPSGPDGTRWWRRRWARRRPRSRRSSTPPRVRA